VYAGECVTTVYLMRRASRKSRNLRLALCGQQQHGGFYAGARHEICSGVMREIDSTPGI
jgi:hypothetical protein